MTGTDRLTAEQLANIRTYAESPQIVVNAPGVLSIRDQRPRRYVEALLAEVDALKAEQFAVERDATVRRQIAKKAHQNLMDERDELKRANAKLAAAVHEAQCRANRMERQYLDIESGAMLYDLQAARELLTEVRADAAADKQRAGDLVAELRRQLGYAWTHATGHALTLKHSTGRVVVVDVIDDPDEVKDDATEGWNNAMGVIRDAIKGGQS